MKTDNLSQREQAVIAEIKTAIAGVEPRRNWLSTLDLVAFGSLTLISFAAYHLFF